MAPLNSLLSRINSVDQSTFEQVAIEVFNLQATNNPVFNEYLNSLGHSGKAQSIDDFVYMPIEFFKNHTIKTGQWQEETVFESSGTTGSATSRHYIKDLSTYQQRTSVHFESIYGPLKDFAILALLPSYIERGNSGLIAMVDYFMSQSKQEEASDYFLNDFGALFQRLNELKKKGQPTILWGVTFALLDFADSYQMDFPELLVMETGGMKGRKEELVRSEVHTKIKRAFNVNDVHSEYGMTELASQAYAVANGIFKPATSMRVFARDINDPFKKLAYQKTGALNIIDLGNLFSCSFIETKDLGMVNSDGSFTVMGRMDNSDIRGCNLLVT